MNSYEKFSQNIRNLREWYYSTIYSYKKTSEFIKNNYSKEEFAGNKSDIYYNKINENKFLMSHSYLEMKWKLVKRYPKYIRELILVRIISDLEVYLTDSIIEIFLINKIPFLSDNVIELHYAELLSVTSLSDIYSKLINKIVRNLHSQGFKEICKYYKKVFNIDFSLFSFNEEGKIYNKKDIERYHEMRHLIVHKLGVTDKIYKSKYNSIQKKISINESELFSILNCIEAFAKYINDEVNSKGLIELCEKNENNIIESCKILIEVLDSIGKRFLEPKFQFIVEEKIYFLQDILYSIKYDNYNRNIAVLELKGERAVIKKYLNLLKKQMKKNVIEFNIINYNSQKDVERLKNKVTVEEINLVKSKLPNKRPWKKNIHKDIASKLNMSNSKVHKIITIIVNETNNKTK